MHTPETSQPLAPITHIPRAHQTFAGAEYVLPSDEAERERLNLQHRLLKRIWDNRCIFAPIIIRPGDRVLDSGTGSATWILDVLSNRTIPNSALLQGIDIERGLFPLDDPQIVSSWNVRFCIGTITSLPATWSSSFTLINQRLLIAGLRSTEWGRAFAECYRVLVPGGWLQLGEVGMWKAGPVTAKHRALVHALFVDKGLLLDCAERIPAMLQAAGFVNIHVEIKDIALGKWAGQDGIDARNNWIGSFHGLKTSILNTGGLGFVQSEEELDALVCAVEKEWDDTPGAFIKYHVIYAQKPGKATMKAAL